MKAEASLTKRGGISKARGKRIGMTSTGQAVSDAERAAYRAEVVKRLGANPAIERMLEAHVKYAEAAAQYARAVAAWQRVEFGGRDSHADPKYQPELAVLHGASEAALKAAHKAMDECVIVLTDGTPLPPLVEPSPVARLVAACRPFTALEAVLNGQNANGDELVCEFETRYGRREILWRDITRLKRAVGEVCFG
jgi:hypothetical protein